MNTTDWRALMRDVARKLLGDPPRRTAREWRYGSKGSLKINLESGTWKDFESGEGGGVLALVRRELQLDHFQAVEWLIQEEFLEKGSPRMPQNQRTAYSPAPTCPLTTHQSERPRPGEHATAGGDKSERLAVLVRKLRERAVSAEGTPARAYLTGRLAWPIDGRDLPGSVRWIAADALSDVPCWPAEAMPGGEWAGAVAFQYGGPGKVPAWKLEALTAHGQRPDQAGTGERWRRNAGSFEGLRFETTDHGSGQLHVCEGEVTALALAVQCAALGKGFAIAAGGTSGFQVAACRNPDQRPVRIHAARDLPGRIAARALVRKLRETGREVEADGLYALNDDRIDAADVLAVEVGERASILEYDGGLPRDESERKAWAASAGRVAARAVETMRLGKRRRFGSTFIGTGLLQPQKRVVGGGGGRFPRGGEAPTPPRPVSLDWYIYFHRTGSISRTKMLP